MPLPTHVNIVEVGPRDGLQNEVQLVPVDVKVALINQLSAAGFSHIEAASFVSPKWVPQMATSPEVMKTIVRQPGVVYSALVPNLKGLEAALAAKVDEIVIFTATSEAFSQKNTHCSIEASFERFAEVIAHAKAHNNMPHVRIRGSVSCAFGCPYQGTVPIADVIEVVCRLRDLGCDDIDLADTIGVATPKQIHQVIEAVAKVCPLECLAGHFHDTNGQALTNIYAGLEVGVTTYHASVAGLGGCPYAVGATGNVATEDVLYLMRGLEIETGVDFDRVALAGQFIARHLGKASASRAGRAWSARCAKHETFQCVQSSRGRSVT